MNYAELKEQVLTDQSEVVDDPESWLEAEEEVEVLWTDADGKPHLAVGQFQGIAVPNEGGPIRFVLKDGTDEINLDPEDIVGMTKKERAPLG